MEARDCKTSDEATTFEQTAMQIQLYAQDYASRRKMYRRYY